MTYKEMEEAKEKARAKNLSFDEQCQIMIKYIQENNVKTIKRSPYAKKTTSRK